MSSSIKIKEDTASNHSNRKLPIMVTTREVVRYSQSLRNHRMGREIYRSKEERESQRKEEEGGRLTASDWMRKVGATTVTSISASKDSKLAMAIKEALDSCPAPRNTVTKVQERPGRSVRDFLVRGNPFHRPSCNRQYFL